MKAAAEKAASEKAATEEAAAAKAAAVRNAAEKAAAQKVSWRKRWLSGWTSWISVPLMKAWWRVGAGVLRVESSEWMECESCGCYLGGENRGRPLRWMSVA